MKTKARTIGMGEEKNFSIIHFEPFIWIRWSPKWYGKEQEGKGEERRREETQERQRGEERRGDGNTMNGTKQKRRQCDVCLDTYRRKGRKEKEGEI